MGERQSSTLGHVLRRTRAPPDHPAAMSLDAITRRQHAVFSRDQALAAGFTRRQVDRHLRDGAWQRMLPSVYALTGVPLGWTSWAWAAALAAGPGAALVADSAAGLWRWQRETWPLHIAVSIARRPLRSCGRLAVHRLDLPDDDVTTVNGLRVTTRLRTAVDVAHLLPVSRAQPMLDRALLLGAVDLNAWTEVVMQSRRRGARQAKALARSAGDRAASQAERVAHALLRQAGITGWRANHTLVLDGVRLIADLVFIAERVVVEIEGWAFHSSPEQRARDEARRIALQLHGWVVLSFSWWDLTQRPDYFVATIRRAVV